MISERKVTVVMTASGRVKEYAAGLTIREVLEDVRRGDGRCEHPDDRPTRLFVGGECVVTDGLTDIAWEYAVLQEEKYEQVDAVLESWVRKRIGRKAVEDSTTTNQRGTA